MSTKKYISYNNLTLYDENIKTYIDDTKQDKTIIVTKNSSGYATMSSSEIWSAIQAGTTVYYCPSSSGGTLHPFLEGTSSVAAFYSCYIDNSRLLGTYTEINNNKNIRTTSYSFDGIPDIDTTLTVSGAAADAKTVGTQITNLSTIIGDGCEEISSEDILALFG